MIKTLSLAYNSRVFMYPLNSLSDRNTTSDQYKKFLDSFNNMDEKKFFNEFQKKYDEFEITKNIDFSEIKFFSFLNFVRYQHHLKSYLRKLKFNHNWNKGVLSITFINNITLVSFQLIFQQNGVVKFLSLDKDYDDNETLSYVIDGTFSSSSLVHKSYKIMRLMGILTEISNEACELSTSFQTLKIHNLHENIRKDKEENVIEYIISK